MPIAAVFSPCRWFAFANGRAVKLCANPCAAARPPLSNPKPLSSVLASTTASRESFTVLAATAAAAAAPCSNSVLAQISPMAKEAIVGRAPTIVTAFSLRRQTEASYQVAIASPMPETRNRSEAAAMMPVSTTTNAGLHG